MKLEVLISAMHQKDMSIADKTGCKSDVLIINQTDHNSYEEEVRDGYLIRMISTTQRGLSRSRNMAMAHASGDICLICDDDVVLADGYESIILDAFTNIPNADVIAFNLNWSSVRSGYNRYHINDVKRVSRFKSFGSCQLAFKRGPIQYNSIWFDVRLGAGSGIIGAGEDGAWQHKVKECGLKIYQCPKCIATVAQGNSTWFNGYNEKYFYDLGANLSINYPVLKYLFLFYFPYRLRKAKTISTIEQLKWLRNGMKGFREGMSYVQYKEKN